VPLFDITKCSKAGARFAYEKGIWFNHEYILKKSNEEIAQLWLPEVQQHCPEATLERVTEVCRMMKDRVSFVKELWPLCSFFFVAPTEYDEKTVKRRWKEDSSATLKELCTVLEGIDDFSLENQEKIVHEWIESKELKLGNVMNAWRLALVGEGKGPGMFDISAFLGKEETIRRTLKACEVLR
jgi:glutamyl-tRNA synthetase